MAYFSRFDPDSNSDACWRATQPALAAGIQRFDFGSRQLRHVALDGVADLRLDVSEMAIALGKLGQFRLINDKSRGWIDRVDAILLINRLAQHNAPASFTFFDEVVEASGADHVAQHTLDVASLRDRHLCLRDRAVAGEVDGGSAQEMQDADALGPAFLRHADKLGGRTLKPGRHHHAIVVPNS